MDKVEKMYEMVVKLSWNEDAGEGWMNIDNLKLCLFTQEHTRSDLLLAWEITERYEKLKTDLEDCQRERDALAEVVRQVEWIYRPLPALQSTADTKMYYVCAWCKADISEGHTEDCPRQAALAMLDGFPE